MRFGSDEISSDPGRIADEAYSASLFGGEPVIALGSAGSNRLRSAILQTMVSMVDGGLGVREAVARPRVHPEGDGVDVEGGVPEAAVAALGGPDKDEAVAYRWSLPPARGARLSDYHIGYVLDDPVCPVTAEVGGVLEESVKALGKAGVRLRRGWPAKRMKT